MKSIAIVLGKRINDDGSMHHLMLKRLNLLIKLMNDIKLDKIIVSGGLANPKAGISEACMMKEFLVNKGINESIIILEDKSMTTTQNAIYCLPLIDEDVDNIYLVTSKEHMYRIYLNPYRTFKSKLRKLENKNIRVIKYYK